MATNPTIVLAALGDEELKKSISTLVETYKQQLEAMKTATDNAVQYMQKSLQGIGAAQTGAKSDNSSVAAKQVKEITQKTKEAEMSFDQMHAAQQKAFGKNNILEQYNQSLANLHNRLAEVRQDIDIYKHAIGSGKAQQVSWGQEGLKKAQQEAERLMATISTLEAQRANFNNLLNPGKGFENYISSLTKANPELAALNEQFKSGNSLLKNYADLTSRTAQTTRQMATDATQQSEAMRKSNEQQTKSAREYGEEIQKTAQILKEYFATTGRGSVALSHERDAAFAIYNPNAGEGQFRSIEEQLAAYKERNRELNLENTTTQAIEDTERQITNERKKQNAITPTQTRASVGEYEALRASIASAIGVREQEIKIADVENDSYKTLSNSLQQVRQAYESLTKGERSGFKGQEMINLMQELDREMRQIQKTMSRPVDFAFVKALPENTLDDIRYKMQQLQSYGSGLDVTKQRDEINQINKKYDELQKKQDEVMGKNSKLASSNNALTRSWNYMKNRLAYVFTVSASTQFIRNLIEIRSQYEMTERALGILVQSAERGTQIFNQLSEQALLSPYTLIELSTAAKQLTAYDIAMTDVVDTTRRLADMTAAVGIPVERLTYALGQIKAYGYLNARDARMFSNAGIPLVKELADHFTELEGRIVSTADVYDRIKKHAIGFNDVMAVVNKVTDEGGRFFEYQSKVAETLKVRLANLTLAWNNMLNDIGEQQQGFLTATINGLKQLFLHWRDVDNAVKTVALSIGSVKAVQFLWLSFLAKAGMDARSTGQIFEFVFGKRMLNLVKSLGSVIGKLFTGLAAHPYVAAIMLATTALIGLIRSTNQQRKANEELNATLREGANEASKSLEAFLRLKDTMDTTSTEGAKKAWDAMREELEKSSFAANDFIAELLEIEDVNERVAKGFDYAEKIREAQLAMENLADTTIFVSQNLWGGIFGEGLADDLKDYVEALDWVNTVEEQIGDTSTYAREGLAKAEKEFTKELQKTADSIKAFFDEQKIEDPKMMREVLERIKSAIVQMNPKIKKEYRDIFNLKLDELILPDGSDDTLLNMFFDALKHNASSAFHGIDDDWMRATGEMSQKQREAVDNTLAHFKETLPEYSSRITQLVYDLNNSGKLRLRIGMTMGVQPYNEFQKEMSYRIKKASKDIDFGPMFLRPTDQEDMIKWAERMWGKIKELQEENEIYANDANDYSQERIRKNETEIRQMQALLALFNLPFEKPKKKGSTKDVLGDALTKEVQLITDIQKRYGEYKKAGVDAQSALAMAGYEYQKSLEEINKTLKNFGVETLTSEQLATMPAHELRDFYERQLDAISKVIVKAKTITYDAEKEAMSEIDGVSKKLIEQTKKFEGFVASVYKDEAGVATIGYGHSAKAPTIKENPIVESMTVTKEEAHRIMIEDYRAIKAAADKTIGNFAESFDSLKKMTASQYESLLDFTYQYGSGNLKKVLEYAQGDMQKIANALGDTTLIGIKNWAGTARREWRQAMFEGRTSTVDSVIKQDIDAIVESGKGIESLEKAIAAMNVEITKVSFKHITDGLNSELGKLKDEYELSVELDAAPELSDVFMDMMGLDKEQMAELPKDFEGVMKRLQDIIDEQLGEDTFIGGRFVLADNLNKTTFEKWLQENLHGLPNEDELAEALSGYVDYANEVRKSETTKQVEEWQKLLEKYAEYEYKVTQIHAEAERERIVARKKGASKEIMDAIDLKEKRELAQAAFDEFQKTPAWVTATGDLATLTDRALGMLIEDLEEYKKSAKNLDPKQIKNINNALRKLRNEQRKDNPFLAIAVAMDEAKGRFEDYQIKIDEVSKVIDDYERKVYKGIDVTEKETEAYKKALEALKKLREEQGEASTVPTKTIVESIRGMHQWVSQASGMFADMFTALGNTRFAETLQNINSIMDKAGTGAAIGNQIGGGKGAIIGAIIGGLTSALTIFSDELTGNKGITRMIENSEHAVSQLERTLRKLEDTAEHAYGTMTVGAQRVALANKQAQLAELERQLQLERSRKSKKKDSERIAELQSQVNDLRIEINNGTQDIINDLLGISSAGDGIESLVEVMIDAFRNGEDAMQAFSDKWDEMIDNMVLKYIISTVFQKWWDGVMKVVNAKEEEFLKAEAEREAAVANAIENTTNEYRRRIGDSEQATKDMTKSAEQRREEGISDRRQTESRRTSGQQSDAFTLWLIEYLSQEGQRYIKDEWPMIQEALSQWLTFGENAKDKGLSALQQGIQGITEDTAGALEAYMNGVSQQVYLHSDLLTQIRDAVVGIDYDVTMATQSQMLLQLQSSYQTQESIRSLLEGWNNASGQAVRVELVG